jgi:hypothetical protein
MSESYGLNRRLITRSSELLHCGEYIRDKLKECREDHPKCATGRTQRLPGRLIEMNLDRSPSNRDKALSIKLVPSKSLSEFPDYVALSHCWGPPGSENTRVVGSNIEEFHAGVSISTLSPLLQDSVWLSFFLGFRYLWIDSLCIIQDSAVDWANECGGMSDCYRNAAITICASNAPGSFGRLVYTPPLPAIDFTEFKKTDGATRLSQIELVASGKHLLYCPVPPPRGTSKPPVFIAQAFRSSSAPLISPHNGICDYFINWVGGPEDELMTHFKEPLQARGWCLQERVLSPRKICFGQTQLFWECRTTKNFELWVKDASDLVPPHILSRFSPQMEISLFDIPSQVEASMPKDPYEWWYDLLNDYGSKDFTFESDLLPGFGGIAQSIIEVTKDRYLAGIWQNDLFRGLTWRLQNYSQDYMSATQMQRNTSEQVNMPRPIESSFAPSWSWASVWGSSRSFLRAQSFFGDALLHHYMNYDTRTAATSKIQKPLSMGPRLLDAQIEPVTPATSITGQLKRAVLYIEAPCTTVIATTTRETRSDVKFDIPAVESKALNQYIFGCPDYPHLLKTQIIEALKQDQIFELECALMGYTSGLHCLLLEKINDDPVTNDGSIPRYRRIGVINIEYKPEAFLDCWRMKTLILE